MPEGRSCDSKPHGSRRPAALISWLAPPCTDFPVLRGLHPVKQDVRFPDLRFWCKHISASGIRERLPRKRSQNGKICATKAKKRFRKYSYFMLNLANRVSRHKFTVDEVTLIIHYQYVLSACWRGAFACASVSASLKTGTAQKSRDSVVNVAEGKITSVIKRKVKEHGSPL